MKKLCSLVILVVSLFSSNCFAADNNVNAFWLDARVVTQLANSGVSTLKIYAGMDEEGNVMYLLVGGDSKYLSMGSAVHMQNDKGVCPPQCDFMYVDLGDANHSSITRVQATAYITNYMTAHPGAKNYAKFTIGGMKTLAAGSSYIKVAIGTKATATGLDAAGAPNESTEVVGTLAVGGL